MLRWLDFASILCVSLTVLGAAALISAGQTFTIVRGKVVSTGSAFIVTEDGKVPTKTISLIIENADRVFRIQPGSIVEYAVSDEDASRVQPGSEVRLLISVHQSRAKLISVDEMPAL